ncbi:hypothetical protein HY477_02540 [Candidatus Uhrbacteria bacterium]|nr:hypothetical protein [Candidatus Uhrbacteria bacterium]
MTYFFVLGRNPLLSLAELYATLSKGWQPLVFGGQILMAECREFDADTLIKRLGGTIKIGKVLENSKQKIENRILDTFTAKTDNKKLFFGLSAYALNEKARLPNVRQLRQLGIEIKRALQAQGHKVRLVTSKEIALSSVIVKQEKLLKQGKELVALYGKNEIYLGQTLAVQEFGEASARDFGRPVRSMGVGMLPVQLAKIMLNLSRAPLNATLLDPFCGLGTVLTEAAQMGYINLIGTDLEQTMIDATRENLKWLATRNESFSNFRQRRTGALASLGMELENNNIRLLSTPVEQLSKHLPPRSVDAIVTEPYLGPTRGMKNLPAQVGEELRIKNDLIELYTKAFEQFAKILKPGGRVVFIFPAFVSKRRPPSLRDEIAKTSDQVLPKIKKLGFQPIQLLSSPYTLNPIPSIIYSRPDQRVLREIFVLEFKK